MSPEFAVSKLDSWIVPPFNMFPSFTWYKCRSKEERLFWIFWRSGYYSVLSLSWLWLLCQSLFNIHYHESPAPSMKTKFHSNQLLILGCHMAVIQSLGDLLYSHHHPHPPATLSHPPLASQGFVWTWGQKSSPKFDALKIFAHYVPFQILTISVLHRKHHWLVVWTHPSQSCRLNGWNT